MNLSVNGYKSLKFSANSICLSTGFHDFPELPAATSSIARTCARSCMALEVALEVAPARKSCINFTRHHDLSQPTLIPRLYEGPSIFYSQRGSSLLLGIVVDANIVAILVQQSHVKSCVCDHRPTTDKNRAMNALLRSTNITTHQYSI